MFWNVIVIYIRIVVFGDRVVMERFLVGIDFYFLFWSFWEESRGGGRDLGVGNV